MEPGARFGRLVAVAFDHRDGHGEAHWLFRCDCGAGPVVRASRVTCGKTRSCGCYRRDLATALGHEHGGREPASVVGYRAALNRVQAARGHASDHRCHFCESPARWWVYDRSDPAPLSETSTPPNGRAHVVAYSLDPYRYLPLCSRCRRKVAVLVLRRADATRTTPPAQALAAPHDGDGVTRAAETRRGGPLTR